MTTFMTYYTGMETQLLLGKPHLNPYILHISRIVDRDSWEVHIYVSTPAQLNPTFQYIVSNCLNRI